jgi:hypothetical protein
MTPDDVAALLKCSSGRVSYWLKIGLLTGTHFNASNAFLYQRPADNVVAQIHARLRRSDSIARNPQPNTSGAV